MLGKTVAGYHGLVPELLLHEKVFRMFLRMNTEKYEVNKFVLTSMCVTMWRREESLIGPKYDRKHFALILTLKH